MCGNYRLYFVIKIIEILVWSLREFKKDNNEINNILLDIVILLM